MEPNFWNFDHIHKPSSCAGVMWGITTNLGRIGSAVWRLSDTSKQTNKETKRQAKFFVGKIENIYLISSFITWKLNMVYLAEEMYVIFKKYISYRKQTCISSVVYLNFNLQTGFNSFCKMYYNTIYIYSVYILRNKIMLVAYFSRHSFIFILFLLTLNRGISWKNNFDDKYKNWGWQINTNEKWGTLRQSTCP